MCLSVMDVFTGTSLISPFGHQQTHDVAAAYAPSFTNEFSSDARVHTSTRVHVCKIIYTEYGDNVEILRREVKHQL